MLKEFLQRLFKKEPEGEAQEISIRAGLEGNCSDFSCTKEHSVVSYGFGTFRLHVTDITPLVVCTQEFCSMSHRQTVVNGQTYRIHGFPTE